MKQNKTQIAVLGCGWLGFPLAKKLVSEGFTVKGSTTSETKMTLLKESDILPFQLVLTEETVQGSITDFLKDVEILIIDVPPGLRNVTPSSVKNFVSKIEKLLPHLEQSSVEKLLFVSSTSVYSEANVMITEETLPNPDTESGRQLAEVEKMLLNNPNFRSTIIRFGGLIGTDRHPIKMLAGRENLDNPDAVINLIHQEDCIGIILKIIEKEAWNETFNAVSPYHPTRQEYYHKKATKMNLAIPKFASDKPSIGKRISSAKIEQVLAYTFSKKNL